MWRRFCRRIERTIIIECSWQSFFNKGNDSGEMEVHTPGGDVMVTVVLLLPAAAGCCYIQCGHWQDNDGLASTWLI